MFTVACCSANSLVVVMAWLGVVAMDRLVVSIVAILVITDHFVGSLVLRVIVVGELWGVVVLDGLVSVVRHSVVLVVHDVVAHWFLNVVLVDDGLFDILVMIFDNRFFVGVHVFDRHIFILVLIVNNRLFDDMLVNDRHFFILVMIVDHRLFDDMVVVDRLFDILVLIVNDRLFDDMDVVDRLFNILVRIVDDRLFDDMLFVDRLFDVLVSIVDNRLFDDMLLVDRLFDVLVSIVDNRLFDNMLVVDRLLDILYMFMDDRLFDILGMLVDDRLLNILDMLVDDWLLDILHMLVDDWLLDNLSVIVDHRLMDDMLMVDGVLDDLGMVVNHRLMDDMLVIDRVLDNLCVIVNHRLMDDMLVVDWIFDNLGMLVNDRLMDNRGMVVPITSRVMIILDLIGILMMAGNCVMHWGRVMSRLCVMHRCNSVMRRCNNVTILLMMSRSAHIMMGWDLVLHLSAHEDFGESEADGVTILIEMLVIPLSQSVHDLVMDILAIDDQVVLDMEDEVPWVREGLRHLTEFVKVSADGCLALFKLVGDVVDDVTEVLDRMQHRVEGSMLGLILDATKSLPDVLGVTEAFDTVGNLSLDRACKETLEDLAHAEEGEVHVRALHRLEVVHLLVLLVINLIEQLLPVVVEVIEELLMVDHLSLSVQEHGRRLAEVLTSVEPLAHAVVVETLARVLEHVHPVDDERLGRLEQDLLGVQEGFSHPLDLLVIVVINLTAMIQHVTDVRDSETELIDGLGDLLVGPVPEAAHGILKVLLDGVGI